MESSTRFHELMKQADMSLKVDLVKAAVKNYLKLNKKFLLENVFHDPAEVIELTVKKVQKYLKSLNEK